MQLSVTSFPDVIELINHTDTVSMVLESDANATESNAVITGFTADTSDSGMTLSFTGDTATATGRYEEQFESEIGYAEPQVDLLTKPVYVEVKSWGPVPDPTATDDIWFLYKYRAPDILTRTVTYTVTGTYDYEVLLPTPVPPVQMPFTATVTKVVNYDLDANVAEFKRYV